MPAHTLPDVLRSGVRWCYQAMVAAGAVQVGGYPDREVSSEIVRTAPQPWTSRRDRWVEREVARGMAELERFLDRQSHH